MNSNINDTFRNKIVEKFDDLINDKCKSRNVEKSIYNYIIKLSKNKNIDRSWNNDIFRNLYLSKVRSIYSNLKRDSYIQNKNFLTLVINDKIDIKNIANMSIYDIFPENWKKILELKSKKDKLKYELKPEAMTDAFKCRKCSSRSTSYYEVQTRSADEPMTQFITCLNCNNRWKQ
jgi:DNA-directed RNA polymerase subunit M/transcription elongation factor TFIIS